MTKWTNAEAAGLLPQIFYVEDKRTVQEQANDRYAHGGGWHPFKRFKLHGNSDVGYSIRYPGDLPLIEQSRAKFRDQTLVLFDSSWVGIIEADGTLSDVARMD